MECKGTNATRARDLIVMLYHVQSKYNLIIELYEGVQCAHKLGIMNSLKMDPLGYNTSLEPP